MSRLLNWIILMLLLGVANSADQPTNDARGKSSATTFLPDYDEDDLDVSPSAHEYTGAQGVEFELLVHLDHSLNEKYDTILEECSDPDQDESESDSLFNQTNEYVFMRRRWLEFFKATHQNNPDSFYLSEQEIAKREKQLHQTIYLQQSLTVMEKYRETLTVSEVIPAFSLNWETSFDFQEGANISENVTQYFKHYKESLRELQDSIDLLEKQKREWSLNIMTSCLNETVPENYTRTAYESLQRKCEIVPFYKTAVIYGKVIEPIILSLAFIISLILNCTLILIFIRCNEIKKSENIMILNLAIVAVLRAVIELPLFYQQTYYSKYFIVERSMLPALHTFFVSLIAFSVLALNVRHFRTITGPLNKSKLTKFKTSGLHIIPVWLFSFVITGIFYYFNTNDNKSTEMMPFYVTFFIIFGISLPIILSTLNFLIAQRLSGIVFDIKEGRYQQLEKFHKRGSKVAIATSIAYFVGYIPDSLGQLVHYLFDKDGYENNVVYHFTIRTFACLFYFNLCVYPIALYVASGTYRRLFKRYLGRCLTSNKQTDERYCTNVTRL